MLVTYLLRILTMSSRDELIQHFLESTGRMYRSMMPVKNQYFSKLGLNRSEFELMMFLNHSSQSTIKDISQAFTMSSSAATQLIEKLVTLGMVKRIESKEDRRVTFVSLNKKGETKCQDFKKYFFSHMREKLAEIPNEDLMKMTSIARKITSRTELN
jgi:DNA-binding MarR family transcriptional regulator